MNPATILFEFSIEKDFLTEKRRNYGYFFLNLIISIIITICGCIHNEISSFPDDYSERIIFNEDIVD